MTSKTKNIYTDKKAQVEAPFEVLVAVILMGFVILAGSYALRNLSQNICIGDKRQDLSEFNHALREVVLGSDLTFKNLFLKSQHCFNREHETTRIVTYTDPHRCAAYCQTATQSCTLIEYFYDDGRRSAYPIPPICTDLPSAITFGSHVECGAGDNEIVLTKDEDGYYVIEPGYYRMFRIGAEAGTSKVCVLRRVPGQTSPE